MSSVLLLGVIIGLSGISTFYITLYCLDNKCYINPRPNNDTNDIPPPPYSE